MKYIVREPGKTGGQEFATATQAVNAALDWYANTGIACELWVTFRPERDLEYEVYDDELEALRKEPSFALFTREIFEHA